MGTAVLDARGNRGRRAGPAVAVWLRQPNFQGSGARGAEGPVETKALENARGSAASYLDTAAFPRSGLIQQLIFEGYTKAEAPFGVDAVGLYFHIKDSPARGSSGRGRRCAAVRRRGPARIGNGKNRQPS